MNSELTAAGQQRIVVSIAARDDYLGGLRAMTHNRRAETLARVLAVLQRDTGAIDYSSLGRAERDLTARNAFTYPGQDEGRDLLTPPR